jgi:hypothetical protein
MSVADEKTISASSRFVASFRIKASLKPGQPVLIARPSFRITVKPPIAVNICGNQLIAENQPITELIYLESIAIDQGGQKDRGIVELRAL